VRFWYHKVTDKETFRGVTTMAKGPKRPQMPQGMGGNMGMMMKQLQKMQEDMENARVELETETVEVSVGGGAITIVITGHQRVQSIKLNPELLDTSDPEWVTDLQDMLVAAVNGAIEQSQTMAANRMESISGGLGNIPGLGGLLGG
jgi:DNA-binding YbaB/EbfC family protein